MSYIKQTWTRGDTITADKLNHMEDGIANNGSFLIVNDEYHEELDGTVLDKTWQEIYDAMEAGVVCFVKSHPDQNNVTLCMIETCYLNNNNNTYNIIVNGYNYTLGHFTTMSSDGYPSWESIGSDEAM